MYLRRIFRNIELKILRKPRSAMVRHRRIAGTVPTPIADSLETITQSPALQNNESLPSAAALDTETETSNIIELSTDLSEVADAVELAEGDESNLDPFTLGTPYGDILWLGPKWETMLVYRGPSMHILQKSSVQN
jgi:hypothetical protein